MRIQPNKLIGELQNEFNAHFPYLRIEFLDKLAYRQNGNTSPKVLMAGVKIGDGQTEIIDGDVEIKPEMTVKDLERIFREQFSMVIRLLRLSGNIWLNTSMTGDWSLRQQDELGCELSLGKTKNKDA